MSKVSVIVPCYNCKDYIENTINMILRQKDAELELLIIDNGSTDGTIEICQKFESDNENIRLFLEHGGPSSGRNIGIRQATGDYLVFFDADDVILDYAVSYMLENAKNSDLGIFSYKINFIENGKSTGSDCVIADSGKFVKSEFLQKCADWNRKDLLSSVWNKMYRRAFLLEHKITFCEETSVDEDMIFNMECLSHANCVACGDKIVYEYCDRRKMRKSLGNQFLKNGIELEIFAQQKMIDFFEYSNTGDFSCYDIAMRTVMSRYSTIFVVSGITKEERRKIARGILDDEKVKLWAEKSRPSGFINRMVASIYKSDSEKRYIIIAKTLFIMRDSMRMLLRKLRGKV